MSIDAPIHQNSAQESVSSDRWVQLIRVATFFGFALPAAAYLWMIHADGVNVIFLDQWSDVALIGHADSGTLHFSTLWAQHNENRIFFPNLIVLGLAYTTHFNVVAEEYLSAFLLFGGTALIICAHKRRSPERRWIWYCPVAFLLLSLAQAVNGLWGFQLCWYLVLFMTMLALFLLDHEPARWPLVAGAIAAAVVASFSVLQGLLVWPAGLLLIYLRRRSGNLIVAWVAGAVVTGVVYFLGFNFHSTQASTTGPTHSLAYFLKIAGDIVGEGNPGALVTLFGAVLVAAAIWTLIRFSFGGRTSTGGRPIALSLILFGLLFSAVTAYGRSGFDIFGSTESRYTVFAIFVLVGLYLALLDPPAASELGRSEPASPAWRSIGRQAFSIRMFVLARVVVIVGIVLTLVFGSANGISQAREIHQNRLNLGQITVRANQYPDFIVEDLYAFHSAQQIRGLVAILREHHLSLFGTGDAVKYLSERPIQYQVVPLRAAVILPRHGSTVHGKQLLDVLGSGSYVITKVDYFLSGPGRARIFIAKGRASEVGWAAAWNTSTVPNGSYMIEAHVSNSDGRSVTTPAIEVRVKNPS